MAAAAGGGGVRVLDLEAGAHHRIDIIHVGTLDVRQAGRIDEDLEAVKVVDLIVLRRLLIERHAVAQARAAAAGHVDAQSMSLAALSLDQLLDLRYRRIRQYYHQSLLSEWSNREEP